MLFFEHLDNPEFTFHKVTHVFVLLDFFLV